MAKHKHSVGRLREMASKLPKNHRPEGGGLRIAHMLTKIGRLPGRVSPLPKEKQEVQNCKIKFPWQCQRKQTGTALLGACKYDVPKNLGFLASLSPCLHSASDIY